MEEVTEPIVVEKEKVTISTNEPTGYYEKNKKLIQYIGGGLLILIAGYFGYQNFYLKPLEKEAKAAMFRAEQYFGTDSFNLALNGDKINIGVLEVINQYGGTQSANLANYYAGMSYLHLGNFDLAIEHLSNFSSKDVMLKALAKGGIGDAYSELNNVDEALKYYLQACKIKNDYTTPIFLMKAAQLLEEKGEFEKAVELYTEIKDLYPNSDEGRSAEKYIARAETLVSKKS